MPLIETLLASASEALAAPLRQARRVTLDAAALARIDAYTGQGRDLHDMVPAIIPLAGPVWFEAAVTAERGTRMQLGYLAEPDGDAAIAVTSYVGASGANRVVGPLRAVATAKGLTIDPALSAEMAHEASVGAGVAIRALLMGIGS
jgi:hypothetical protein